VGSDPGLLRVQAANLFIAYLGVDTARTGNRLGVVHFGGQSELVVPLTPLDSPGQRRSIQAAIADPRRLDWTDPLEALQLAYRTLFPHGQRDPDRQPVVILLTDGKPELPDTGTSQRAAYVADLRALVDRFRERGCPIFTIALSNAATDADPDIQTVYRNLWQEIAARTPPAEYHEARTADDLPRIYHAVVARLVGAEADVPAIEVPVSGQVTRTLIVDAGLARMTLVVLRSDPALEVRLLRPGGAPARSDDPDVRHAGVPGSTREEIWSVAEPRPGRWTLELRGHGTVLIWQDAIPQAGPPASRYGIEIPALPTHVPAGQPVDVGDISVRDVSTGEAVAGSGTRARLQIVAELHRAGFAEATFLAHDDGQGCDVEANDGRHCVTLPDPPPGACTLRLCALLDGEEVARRDVAFEVIPLPALEVVSPVPETALMPGDGVPVEVRVRQGEGAMGEDDLAAWTLPLLGLAGLLALAGTGGVLIRHRRARATLDGSLRVLAAPPGQPAGVVLDLPAAGSAVLGGTDRRNISLPGEIPRATLRADRTPAGDVETWISSLTGEGTGAGASHLMLNGHPLEAARRLYDGDVVTLGDYRLRYENLRQAGVRRSRRRPQRRVNWMGGVK